MAIHNQLKKISITPQANTIPYSDENGYISNWLTNDPVISSLKGQNEFIGTVTTAPSPDTQSILTQFVVDTVGRQPRNGDEVAIEDVGELWIFSGTSWVFFTNTTLSDATTTSKGVVQIGSGLSVSSGVVSLDSTAVTTSRTVVNSTSTTPSIALAANTDYVFSNNLSSLTITSVPTSQYDINLYFSTGASFTFSCSSVTSWYLSDNPPTFDTNSTYKITFSQGKGQVLKVGEVSANVSPTLTYFDNNTGTTLSTSIVFASYNLVKVYKNGVLLRPNSGVNTYDYSLSTTTVTFTEALVSTDTICIETI